MRHETRRNSFLPAAAFAAAVLLVGPATRAQVTGGTDVNLSQKAGADSECSISKNPSNKNQLFAFCNTGSPGLFAARSNNVGVTWTYPDPVDKTIADGNLGQGPAACCDPTSSWDTFGNLFITYIDSTVNHIVTILSTDGGLTFTNLASFAGSVDQPTVVAANTTALGAPVAVWIVWNQSGQMVARGAAVTGLGVVGAFGPLQTIPGTVNCSFGDVAIAPSGAVVQACQTPTGGQGPGTILVNIDADGLGPGNFGAAITATTTNVGGFDFIPPQNARSVDAEAGLAFDSNLASPHFGRLYLVYTDEVVNESNDTDIMLRFSDNNGATWSAPIRVNDDPAVPIRSQFLPKIALNIDSGNIAICWHDSRNSLTNTAMQEFCTIANRTLFPAFIGANVQISDGTSTSNGAGVEFGDYSGLAYYRGVAHPIWGDTSNSTGNNPNGTANFDAYTDRVSGGAAAMEGDPHLTTVDGVHFNFQGAGEFVSLRDPDGLEIQTRETAIATTFNPGPDPYDGVASCVSLNTAVAARVGRHRVTYQPNISGVPDPSGMQLRVDGVLTTLGSAGLNLGSGGRVANTAGGTGIEIDFPDGTVLIATSAWWASQSKWYLNVNAFRTPATEGIVGALAPGSWLPPLPNGASVGPLPPTVHQRYLDLYQTFGHAWRVTPATSLFDYAPGTSTATFTISTWPPEGGPCNVVPSDPSAPVAQGTDTATAEQACEKLDAKTARDDCAFDVMVTGETGFATTYERSRKLVADWTAVAVVQEDEVAPKDPGTP